jgi:tetratricopeptide (TPR) repeat protein
MSRRRISSAEPVHALGSGSLLRSPGHSPGIGPEPLEGLAGRCPGGRIGSQPTEASGIGGALLPIQLEARGRFCFLPRAGGSAWRQGKERDGGKVTTNQSSGPTKRRIRFQLVCFWLGSLLNGLLPGTGSASALPRVHEPEAPFPVRQDGETLTLEGLRERVRQLQDTGTSAELGLAWQALATAYEDAGFQEAATAAARMAIPHLEASGDEARLAKARNQLGLLHWLDAHYDSAAVHLNEARLLWTRLQDRRALGMVYNNLGVAHYQWGNHEMALEAFLQALEYRREVGDKAGEARVLANLGVTYHDWGQYQRSKEALEQALRIADGVEDAAVQGYAHQNMGLLLLSLGDFQGAEEAYQASATYLDGDPANSLSGLALVYVKKGDPERALPILNDLLAEAEELGQVRRHIRALLYLGQAHRAREDHFLAIQYLTRGLEVARGREQRTLALAMFGELADLYQVVGDEGRALSQLRAYNALRDSIFNQAAGQRIAAMEARAEAESRERENALLREEQRVREAVIQRQRTVVSLGGAFFLVSLSLVAVLVHFNLKGRERETALAGANAALERVNVELRQALSEVRTLEGLIPICANCKKVRDDEGFWQAVETYIGQRSGAHFSHSICTQCGPKLYGPYWGKDGGDPEGSDPRAERPSESSVDSGAGRR